jgi:hypothetical protein
MSLTPTADCGDKEDIPIRMGPWRHLMFVTQELNMGLTALYKLIESNQVAFIRPDNAQESRTYLHIDWVNALKSQYPVAKLCMRQCHILMDDISYDELRKIIPRKKPRELASSVQVANLNEILESDFILVGERKWILPIFDERWIGRDRATDLIRYFHGLKKKNSAGKWEYFMQGVFKIRSETLANFHQTRKELELINDETF